MKKAVSAVFFCAAVAAVTASAPQITAPAPLTPEQALDRRGMGELQFSPDGSRLVFTVSEAVKGTSRVRALWMLDVASGQVRQLTFSGKSDNAPRWSPDGTSIAFVSDRDGAPQLYRLSLRGGEAEALTDRKEAVGAFRWSPDGRRIAFLMADAKPESQQMREKDKDDARVVDKDDRHSRVWTVDIASHQLKPITTGRWRIGQFDWLPSGDRLVAIATPTPDVDLWTDRLYAIQIENGDFTEIAAPRGPLGGLSVSPDGKTIVYVGARVDGPDAHDLYLQPVGGGAAQNLTAASIDRPVAEPRWIDNQSIAIHVSRGFRNTLAIVGRDGKATPSKAPQRSIRLQPVIVARWRMSGGPRARRSCG
jgi:Tol biopolymer transport system component